MAYLNLDLDFFTHPKTMRLVGLLGKDSAILPIRLWCYVGKYHSTNGRLAGYSPQEVESIVGWWGKAGQMIDAMLKVKFLNKLKEGGYEVNDWLAHQGHLKMFKERAQKAAEKRWGISNATSNAQDEPKQSPVHTIPNSTTPNQTGHDIQQEPPPVRYFYQKYKEKFGKEYIASFAKDGKVFKDLLNTIDKGELCTLIDKFFISTDAFIQSTDYGVGVFRQQINKLRKAASIINLTKQQQSNLQQLVDLRKEQPDAISSV